jgi:dTMP kinase
VFISFEGVDGSGKSTQAKLLAGELGTDAVLVREPGGTPASERIRELLADPGVPLDPLAELLLFCAARAQLIGEVIRPALEAGRTVICDRYCDSSIAYQGAGRGLGADYVRRLCNTTTGGLWPDLTILLWVEPERALARTRGGDRFEQEGIDFQRRVAAAYRESAEREPRRVRLIDAEGSVEQVHDAVMGELRSRPEAASRR